MFERFTETARRVIFFARYEACQYGSPYIETEHLLLGVMREGRSLMVHAFGPELELKEIRTEIEKFTPTGMPVTTSAEVPLTEESKKVLLFAVEECDAAGSRTLGPEYLLLGILRADESQAARILREKGAQLESIRALVVTHPSAPPTPAGSKLVAELSAEAMDVLDTFIARIRSDDPRELPLPLAVHAHAVDSTGLTWAGQDEIAKGSKVIFGAYSGKSVTSKRVRVDAGPGQTLIATLLWFNLAADFEPRKPGHRMTVILGQEGEKWRVFFVQITPIITA